MGTEGRVEIELNEVQKLCTIVHNMPFPKYQLFVQSHSVNLSTRNRVLLFAENWILKAAFLTWLVAECS